MIRKFWRARRAPPVAVTAQDLEKLNLLLSLVNERSQPNLNALTAVVRNVNVANLSLKSFGYELGRKLAEALPTGRETSARHVGLKSKACVQADLESDWMAHWCAQLRTPVILHRNIWEMGYILQTLFENGHLRPGAKGLGFGCGTEPIPSYLASHGVSLTVTELAPEAAQAAGWRAGEQHASNRERAFQSHLVGWDMFDELVGFRHVDMNAIPDDLTGYDFCWSACALEHLGSIRQGAEFIRNSLHTLRPGGLAVHTTEFNIDPTGRTLDNWPTVMFQRKHLEQLAEHLRSDGHEVAELDYNLGDKPMDRFIDVPPWGHDLSKDLSEWLGQPLHLKLALDGFASTSFGVVIRKAG